MHAFPIFSEEGKGLLTIGIVGISMAPLKALTERATEIEANPPKGGDLPGLAEQRVEQAARLREGAANAEFVTIPGFYSFPSTCTASTFGGLMEGMLTIECPRRPAYSRREARLTLHHPQQAVVPWHDPRRLDGSARATDHRPSLL